MHFTMKVKMIVTQRNCNSSQNVADVAKSSQQSAGFALVAVCCCVV